jgi:hypothetical protein
MFRDYLRNLRIFNDQSMQLSLDVRKILMEEYLEMKLLWNKAQSWETNTRLQLWSHKACFSIAQIFSYKNLLLLFLLFLFYFDETLIA